MPRFVFPFLPYSIVNDHSEISEDYLPFPTSGSSLNYSRVTYKTRLLSALRPHFFCVAANFIAKTMKTKPCLPIGPQTRTSSWWRWRESNPRHSACKADALPIELHPHAADVPCVRDTPFAKYLPYGVAARTQPADGGPG